MERKLLILMSGLTIGLFIAFVAAATIAFRNSRPQITAGSRTTAGLTGGASQSAQVAIPSGISQDHIEIIRKQLKRSTPAGDWEEIEWRTKELDAYTETKWETEGEATDPPPRNAAEAAASFSARRMQAREQGQPLPKPVPVEVNVPAGTETTLRFRTQNPLGGMSIFEVSLQQREESYAYRGIGDDFPEPIAVD